MPRSMRFVLAAGVLALSPSVFASGLYLKLAEGPKPAPDAGASVTLTVQAVSTIDLRLPQSPLFLVDDGKGMRIASEADPKPVDVPASVRVSPEETFDGSWRLNLAPGTYRVKVRYKLADRTVESNTVKVQVPGPEAASK